MKIVKKHARKPLSKFESVNKENNMVRVSRKQLRDLIEQVVGYKAPKKNSDDNTDYLQMGSSSVAAEPGSQNAIKADRDSAASLTKGRQDALDKGDLDTARTDGHQLQMTDDELQNEMFSRGRMKISESQLRSVIRGSLIAEIASSSLTSLAGPGGQKAAMNIRRRSPDAWALYTAMSGLGTDEEKVWSILESREGSIPVLYDEFSDLMTTLKQEAAGFEKGVADHGMDFLKNSAIFAIALGAGGYYFGRKKGRDVGRQVGIKSVRKAQAIADDGGLMVLNPVLGAYHSLTNPRTGEKNRAKIKQAVKGIGRTVKKVAPYSSPGAFVASKVLGRFSEGVHEQVEPKNAIERGAAAVFGKGGEMVGGTTGAYQGAKTGILAGAIVTAVMALVDKMNVDSYDDDLITWLEDDGMDDAAAFVEERL